MNSGTGITPVKFTRRMRVPRAVLLCAKMPKLARNPAYSVRSQCDPRTPAGLNGGTFVALFHLTAMEHEHTVEAIGERLAAGPRHNYLRDWIYGGIDGSVTTFAVVTGVVGAQLSPVIIVIMGFANLVGDGFSMAASNFLGTKSEHDDIGRLTAIERRHIEVAPEGEREEVRQIFAAKGFAGADLNRVVELITSDPDRWVRTMLTEEYGLPLEARSPWLAAWTTFSAFAICGLVPLIPFLVRVPNAFAVSIVLTGAVFFGIGSIKSRWSTVSWWRSGLSTLLVGGIAAGLAYVVGLFLRSLAS